LERIEEGFFIVSVSGGGGGEGREDACGDNSTTAGGDGISCQGASCITTGGDFLRRSSILCSISFFISSDSAKIAKQTSGSVLYQRTHSERHITEKLQRRKKQQDPSRHGKRILQKGAVAFPNCRRSYSRTSYAAERHVTDRQEDQVN